MHSIVTTPGFIVGSYNRDEADRLFRIFTRDMGMIWTKAQGIRLEKSKLRYHTNEYDLSLFSFVRGRDIWRLVNVASTPDNSYTNSVLSRDTDVDFVYLDKSASKARIASLLRRLVQDEGEHIELFIHIHSYIDFLNTAKELTDENINIIETIVSARILHTLGYIGSDELLDRFINTSNIDKNLLGEIKEILPLINKHVNKGLRGSHL